MAKEKKFITCDGNTAAAHVSYMFTEVAAIYPHMGAHQVKDKIEHRLEIPFVLIAQTVGDAGKIRFQSNHCTSCCASVGAGFYPARSSAPLVTDAGRCGHRPLRNSIVKPSVGADASVRPPTTHRTPGRARGPCPTKTLVGRNPCVPPHTALLAMCHCQASAHTGCGNPSFNMQTDSSRPNRPAHRRWR